MDGVGVVKFARCLIRTGVVKFARCLIRTGVVKFARYVHLKVSLWLHF